jgi:ABC-type multidrug transport system ATPase subunit
LLPNEGTATIAGFDVVRDYKSIRSSIGYMPGKFSLYQDLTIAENLTFFATIFGTTLEENYDAIKEIYVQIEPFKDRRAGAFWWNEAEASFVLCPDTQTQSSIS